MCDDVNAKEKMQTTTLFINFACLVVRVKKRKAKGRLTIDGALALDRGALEDRICAMRHWKVHDVWIGM